MCIRDRDLLMPCRIDPHQDMHRLLGHRVSSDIDISLSLIHISFEKIADAKGVRYVDILGPMMDTVGTITTTKPRMKPDIIHKLDEEYFKKVEAIEFAVKYDDGKNPAG